MDPWISLVRLGDLDLTLPLAAAAFGWMAAARAWRIAMCWGLLFGAGVLLVGVSKVAFMAWGSGLPALGFKSFSGHATGVTAVFPTLFWLLLRGAGNNLARAGAALGLGLGLVVGVLLVVLDFHTAAEAVAGCLLGAAISLAWIRLAGAGVGAASPASLGWFALVFLASTWLMTFAHVGWWMIRLATLLSGQARPYPLDSVDTCC
jgi:hypothetical protein